MLLDGLMKNAWILAFVAAVAVWEAAAPRHRRVAGRSVRWPTSFTLGPVNALFTTAFRFHPIEACVTNVTALACIGFFGVPALAVLVHQTLAVSLTVLEHTNARVPAVIESWAGRVFVTPSMHRIHHSAAARNTD